MARTWSAACTFSNSASCRSTHGSQAVDRFARIVAQRLRTAGGLVGEIADGQPVAVAVDAHHHREDVVARPVGGADAHQLLADRAFDAATRQRLPGVDQRLRRLVDADAESPEAGRIERDDVLLFLLAAQVDALDAGHLFELGLHLLGEQLQGALGRRVRRIGRCQVDLEHRQRDVHLDLLERRRHGTAVDHRQLVLHRLDAQAQLVVATCEIVAVLEFDTDERLALDAFGTDEVQPFHAAYRVLHRLGHLPFDLVGRGARKEADDDRFADRDVGEAVDGHPRNDDEDREDDQADEQQVHRRGLPDAEPDDRFHAEGHVSRRRRRASAPHPRAAARR
jgi:hypothetical protein